MKQLLLTVAMMMAAFAIYAEDLQYKLVRYYDDYDMELCEFKYDSGNKLVAVHNVLNGAESFESYDSVRYDSNGDMVRIETWQMFYDENYNPYFRWVNYVDYTYDGQHRPTSRKNYNYIGGEWTLGGTYTYTYDADGHKVRSQLNFVGTLFEDITYTYENGRLTEERWKTDYEFTGTLSDYEKKTYHYDEDGLLTDVEDSTFEGGRYSFYKRDEYRYDGNGNCISHKRFNSNVNETERQIYTYCDKLKAETLMPRTPEMDYCESRPQNTTYNTNVYTNEEYWALDANWHLQHICDYTYEYVGINESGVGDVNEEVVREVMSVKKVFIDGRIYIECGGKVYDMNGRIVK